MARRTQVLPALFLAASLPLAACSSEVDNKPAAQVKAAADRTADTAASFEKTVPGRSLALDVAQSKLEFVGAKVTGDHHGSFGQYSGKLLLTPDGAVAKLEVEVQTASLQVQPEKLQNHLKSKDFFEVETYPTAKFSLDKFTPAGSESGPHAVSGELEMHGVRKQIEFPAQVDFSEREVSATASFTINRKDFGIVYPGMPDDLIKDDVLLNLKLRFPKS